jgi:hypothetical protein
LRANSHDADSENQANRDLDPTTHLYVPDHESWQDRVRPISPTAHGRVSVGGGCDDIAIDTPSFHSGVLSPEIGYWPTLEDKDKEEVSAHNSRRSHNEPDDGSLDW